MGRPANSIIFLVGICLFCSCGFDSDSPSLPSVRIRYVNAAHLDSVQLLDSIAVKPILYRSVPDLSQLSVEERKKAFLSIMVPSLLVADLKRDSLRVMTNYYLAKEVWDQEDSLEFTQIWNSFNPADTSDLLVRLKSPPHSLALAQAIIESGWGTSRFFTKANNVYGVWSYRTTEPRISAELTRSSSPVFLRKYDNISEAVDDYYRLLSTARPYRNFRKVLSVSDNPYELADALIHYSELKHEYIRRLKSVIRSNKLVQYDSCYIRKEYLVEM